MFSSLTKSLSSYLPPIRGPKALIASYLSSALAEHFDVDKDKIESSLLSDARIVLRDARLRPEKYRQGGAVVTTLGTVEEVVFSWRWSYPGETADVTSGGGGGVEAAQQAAGGVVRDAKLSIRGLDFTLLMAPATNDEVDDEEFVDAASAEDELPAPTAVPAGGSSGEKGTNEGYLQKYMQQIVDHLTLTVEDFKITVEIVAPPNFAGCGGGGSDSLTIVFGGKSIELVSLGRAAARDGTSSSSRSLSGAVDPNSPASSSLNQRIAFRSLFAEVLEKNNKLTTNHPLIDPISYAATVSRLSGRRFVDGIFSGLEVLGHQSWDGAAGGGSNKTDSRGKDEEKADDDIVLHAGLAQIRAMCLLGTMLADPTAANKSSASAHAEDPVQPKRPSGGSANSTLFTIPINNLAVVLPNGARLSVPHSAFLYRVDGKVCKIQGREGSGIRLNGKSLLCFDETETGDNAWSIDFARSALTVGGISAGARSDQNRAAASIRIDEGSIKEVLDGVAMISSNQCMADLSTKLASGGVGSDSAEHTAQPWSFSANGKIVARVEATMDGKDEWLEMSLDSPSMTMSATGSGDSGQLLSSFRCFGVAIGPCSFGRVSAQSPPIVLQRSGQLSVEGKVTCEAESPTVLQRMQAFAHRFTYLFASETEGSRGAGSTHSIHVPEISLSIDEIDAKLHAKEMLLSGPTLSCQQLQVSGGDTKASFGDITGTIGEDIVVDVGCIDRVETAMFSLAEPIKEAKLALRKSVALVHVPTLLIDLLPPATSSASSDGSSASSTSPTLPFPIYPVQFVSKHICLRSWRNPRCAVSLESICLSAKPLGTSIQLKSLQEITTKLMNASGDWVSASIGKFRAVVSENLSLEKVESAGASVGPCSFGKLLCHLPSMTITPGGTGLVIRQSVTGILESKAFAENLKAMVTDAVGNFLQQTEGAPSGGLNVGFPFPADIAAISILIKEGGLEAVFKQIRVNGTTAQCEGVSIADERGTSLKGGGMDVNMGSQVILSFRSIDEARVPGVVQLSDSLRGASICWNGEMITARVPSVQLALLSEGVQEDNKKNSLPTKEISNEDCWPIPFPVRVMIAEMTVWPNGLPSQTATSLALSQVDLRMRAAGTHLAVETHQRLSLRLENPKKEWLNASIEPSSAVVSVAGARLTLRQMSFGGAHVGPYSQGELSLEVPSATFLPGSNELAVQAINVTIESPDVADSLKAFCISTFPPSPTKTESVDSGVEFVLPFVLTTPSLKAEMLVPKGKLTVDNIKIDQDMISVASVHFSEASGSSLSLIDLKASPLSDLKAEIKTIYTFNVPGIMDVTEPTSNVVLSFKDDCLWVAMTSLSVELADSNVAPSHSDQGNVSSVPFALPFPLRFILDDLYLKTKDEHFIGVKGIDLSVSSTGTSYSVQSFGNIRARLEHQLQIGMPNEGRRNQKSWLEAEAAPAKMTIACSDRVGLEVQELRCEGFSLGPCSFGHLFGRVPALTIINNGSGLESQIKGSIDATLSSFEVGQRLQHLVDSFFPSSQSNQSFSIKLPELVCAVKAPKVQVIVRNIHYDGVVGSCGALDCTEGTGMSASARGMNFTLSPEMNFTLDKLEGLFVPGVMKLTSPVIGTTCSFRDNALDFKIESVALNLIDEAVNSEKEHVKSIDQISLPFPVSLTLKELNVHPVPTYPESEIKLTGIEVCAIPEDVTPREPETLLRPAVRLSLRKVASIEHEMFKVQNMSASGLVFPPNTDEIQHLSIDASSASVTAGFTSVEWSALFGNGEDGGNLSRNIKLPFARTGEIKLALMYKGALVSVAETSIDIPPFVGSATTSLDDVKVHFSQAVLQRAPGLLSRIEVLGTNVVDSAATNAGRLAGLSVGSAAAASQLAGSAVGSVAGLAVVDSVKGAVAAGKKSRGVSTDEGYQLGDFSRGLVRSVHESVKSGATQRRGESGSYVPGDFVVGASSAVGQYACSNKSRLGSAGGSGVGMALGTALAGPVGFVAGSYLGSKVGGAALKDGSEKPGNDTNYASTPSRTSSNACARNSSRELLGRGSSAQPAKKSTEQDLLGIGSSSLLSQPAPPRKKAPEQVDLLSFGPPVASEIVVPPTCVPHVNKSASQSFGGQNAYSNNQMPQQIGSTANASGCADLLGLGTYAPEKSINNNDANSAGIFASGQEVPASLHPNAMYGSQTQQAKSQGLHQFHQQQAVSHRGQQLPTNRRHGAPVSHHGGQGSSVTEIPHASSGQMVSENQQGYRFGDVTRGIISRGKQKGGRDSTSGYKFGDFTRGLLG